MKITMIVSSRNGMPYLERCLKSIVVASSGLDVEVLYEDGCSTDGSAECAARILGPSAVNIQHDRGFSDAVNRAYRRATGDVVGVLPSDDMLAPESLRHVADAFASHREAQWGIGYYEIIDANDAPIRPLHTWYKNRAIRNFRLWRLMLENIVPYVSFFIRRPFRDSIGDFLTEEVNISNDYDYFIRCAKRCKPLIIPHVLGRWRYHATSNSGSRMWRMSWDAWKVCRSHTSNPFIIAANGACCLRNALLFDKIG
jgi:glycosyltransferase involved in cell wall biosynthesis